jgi:hypothetical protein
MVSSDQSQAKSKALLTGLLFDDAGNGMIPTHATKNRVRYRYLPTAAQTPGRYPQGD